MPFPLSPDSTCQGQDTLRAVHLLVMQEDFLVWSVCTAETVNALIWQCIDFISQILCKANADLTRVG